jgi:hypothetical protein
MKRKRLSCQGLILVALTAAGCDTDLAPNDPAESTATSDIKNGAPWNPWTQGTETWTRNVVSLTTPIGFCTGTLLNYEWVLTAGHCFGAPPLPAPSQVTVYHVLADGSTEQASGTELYQDPAAGVDVALIRLATPLHPGVGTLPLYGGTTASLVGQSVFCAGYGAIGVGPSCSAANPTCPSGQSCDTAWGVCLTPDDNQLRTATFTIIQDGTDPNLYYQFQVPNALGQIELPGDSGSSCWNGSALTGVNKAGNAVNYDRQNAIPASRDWINSYVNPFLIGMKNRPGARCRPAAGGTPVYSSDGSMLGDGSGTVAICPIDRPIAPTASNFVSVPHVWVTDQNPNEDVCCHLQSSNPGGALIVGEDVCSSGASGAGQDLLLSSLYDPYTYSQFSIQCTIPPPSSNGAPSSVDGYRVELSAR